MMGGMSVAREDHTLILNNPIKMGKVTIPHPKKDLPVGTVKAIRKQAQLK